MCFVGELAAPLNVQKVRLGVPQCSPPRIWTLLTALDTRCVRDLGAHLRPSSRLAAGPPLTSDGGAAPRIWTLLIALDLSRRWKEEEPMFHRESGVLKTTYE